MTASVAFRRLKLLGSGMALPGTPLDSEELLSRLARNFGVSTRLGAAIGKRLGMVLRYHSRDWRLRLEAPRAGARNPELASMAVADALAEAALPIGSLQYLLGHTTTPARLLPPNVSEVADRLGHAGPYAELRQGSTGFASALLLAAGLASEPGSAPIVIVGSEVGSVFCDPLSLRVDPGQWVNIMQMSDGAAAVAVGPDDGRPGARIESVFYGHIGLEHAPAFTLDEGGSDYPAVREGHAMATFHCDFERVKRDAPALYRAAFAGAREAGIDIDGIDLIVPHQASGNSVKRLARAFNLPTSKLFGNGDRVGNLGSASMWAALHELRHSTLLKPGDRVLCIGVEAAHYMYGGFVYVHA